MCRCIRQKDGRFAVKRSKPDEGTEQKPLDSPRRRHSLLSLGAGLIFITAMLFVQACQRESPVNFSTPYQAILLTNGQGYFGKLEQTGSRFSVLTDVFYIQSKTSPDTKEVTSGLVKRGKEWHEPDRMIINSEHILLIEPVKPDSTVGKLIEEANKKK